MNILIVLTDQRRKCYRDFFLSSPLSSAFLFYSNGTAFILFPLSRLRTHSVVNWETLGLIHFVLFHFLLLSCVSLDSSEIVLAPDVRTALFPPIQLVSFCQNSAYSTSFLWFAFYT